LGERIAHNFRPKERTVSFAALLRPHSDDEIVRLARDIKNLCHRAGLLFASAAEDTFLPTSDTHDLTLSRSNKTSATKDRKTVSRLMRLYLRATQR
jgi:hypothetical protein